MKKFLVTQECDYVQGHLRYGHKECYIYADSLEDAKKKFKDEGYEDDMELIVDDYCVEDYDCYDNPYEFTEVAN